MARMSLDENRRIIKFVPEIVQLWSNNSPLTWITANKRRWTNAGFLLVQRHRRWASINPALVQRVGSAGISWETAWTNELHEHVYTWCKQTVYHQTALSKYSHQLYNISSLIHSTNKRGLALVKSETSVMHWKVEKRYYQLVVIYVYTRAVHNM